MENKFNLEKNYKAFIDMVLTNRYQIKKFIARGIYGNVYLAVDQKKRDRKVVVKITQDHDMNKLEYNVLKKLN